MSDREILELAAKALGGQARFDFSPDGAPWLQGVLAGRPQPYPVRWNPLTDDGDALRLMVRLRLEPRFLDNSHSKGAEPSRATLHNVAGIVESIDDNPYAATRRAIVRAAAEIGKGV